MSKVIHHIGKGNYLYEHRREGSKVRCYYIGSAKTKNGKTLICPKKGKPYEYTKQLNAAIKDEKSAVPEYNKLKKITSSKKDKKTISKIIKDEKRHRKELESIKRQKSAMKHKNVLGAGAKKRKYAGLTADEKFTVVMKEYKRGTLHSSDGKIVKKKAQAIAIGYSEARHIDPKYGRKNYAGNSKQNKYDNAFKYAINKTKSDKTIKYKIVKDDSGHPGAAMYAKGKTIYIYPKYVDSKYKTHVMFSKEDGVKPLSKEQFIKWKLLHELHHVNTTKNGFVGYPKDVKTKKGTLTGKYKEERDATLYANKYIPNKELKVSTFARYANTDKDVKDAKKHGVNLTD